MKKFDKEPIAWITRGGKHIPIFDDNDKNDELLKLTEEEWMDNEEIKVGGKVEVGESSAMDMKGKTIPGTRRWRVLFVYKEGTPFEKRIYGHSKTYNIDWGGQPITEAKRDAYKKYIKSKK